MTPAEVFPVSIMETECPNLKLEHDENRTLEQRKKKLSRLLFSLACHVHFEIKQETSSKKGHMYHF